MSVNINKVAKQLIENQPPINSFENRLIKEMNLELTHWSDVSKFENIVELSIDGVDFSAKIEKQFFSHNLPELGGAK